MKREDFNAAMAIYAEADQRATAGLIEMLTAAVLLKLNPPAHPGDVVHVSISPAELSEMVATHHIESRYVDGEMTVFVTPLDVPADA